MKLTVGQLAKQIGAELIGASSIEVSSVLPIDAAGAESITFVAEEKFRDKVKTSKAGAVLTNEKINDSEKPQLVVKNVNAALIEVLKIFAPQLKKPAAGINEYAIAGKDVKIGEGVSIGPYAIIEDGAEIGENSVIGSGCKIGQNTKIGKNCRFDSNVVIYHNCFIGNNVIIQANSTIGSTGFGYYLIDGALKLIPHNGGVVIEDFVEIGANSCIDRAKFGNTIIGAGTKIDNLVQIAHNVVIGRCCILVSQSGVAGSTCLGDGVVLAGQSGIMDNLKIGAGVIVGAKSGVMQNVEPGQKFAGTPAMEVKEEFRMLAAMKRASKVAAQVKQLAARIEKLETAENDKR